MMVVSFQSRIFCAVSGSSFFFSFPLHFIVRYNSHIYICVCYIDEAYNFRRLYMWACWWCECFAMKCSPFKHSAHLNGSIFADYCCVCVEVLNWTMCESLLLLLLAFVSTRSIPSHAKAGISCYCFCSLLFRVLFTFDSLLSMCCIFSIHDPKTHRMHIQNSLKAIVFKFVLPIDLVYALIKYWHR